MNKTAISYLDYTWNPGHGCSWISPGCDNCWARRTAEGRLRGRCGYDRNKPFAVTLHHDRLHEPFKVKAPSRVGVWFMGDMFHEEINIRGPFIRDIFRIMASCSQHTFMLLTKRPKRMRAAVEYLMRDKEEWLVNTCNVQLWLSVEDQKRLEERIEDFLAIPALVHGLSLEPLLGPVDLRPYVKGINGLIIGGESGPDARPMHPHWPMDILEAYEPGGGSFYFKQWGAWWPIHGTGDPESSPEEYNAPYVWVSLEGATHDSGGLPDALMLKHSAGRLLAGKEYNDLPACPDLETAMTMAKPIDCWFDCRHGQVLGDWGHMCYHPTDPRRRILKAPYWSLGLEGCPRPDWCPLTIEEITSGDYLKNEIVRPRRDANAQV